VTNGKSWLKTFLTFGLCCVGTVVYGQATIEMESNFDLKSVQLVKFTEGKLSIMDVYTVKELALSNNIQMKFLVVQTRTADNTQSCGTLAYRYVRLMINRSSDDGIEIPASKYNEFVTAINYMTKFRDNFEKIQTGKLKMFEYSFGDDRLNMMGDKNEVGMELSTKKEKVMVSVLSTKDLKVINSFSDNINSVQKFMASHKFDECL
jgi:hypothetical protein